MGKNISKKATAPGGKGLKVDRYFSKEGKTYMIYSNTKRSSDTQPIGRRCI